MKGEKKIQSNTAIYIKLYMLHHSVADYDDVNGK